MPRRTHKNKVYSAEFKKSAVQAYIEGKGSLRDICKQYEMCV